MTKSTLTTALALHCALFAASGTLASTHNPAGVRQRWEIPVRTFVGYSEEAERAIVARSADQDAQATSPAFRFCGDHYMSRRARDGTVQSRLVLWLWQAPREGVELKLLVFCRSVDPLVQLAPDLELPAEITVLDKSPVAVMTPTDRGVPTSECQIRVPGPLIPGRHRVYLVDSESGWWCARDLVVSVGQ